MFWVRSDLESGKNLERKLRVVNFWGRIEVGGVPGKVRFGIWKEN